MSDKGPNEVIRTKRSVIEKRILDVLDDGEHVAIMANEADLTVLIGALAAWAPSGPSRARELLEGMRQLRREAFP